MYRLSGLIPDEEVFQKHLQSVDRTLRVYNQILHEQKYIAGDVRDVHPFAALFVDLYNLAGNHHGRPLPPSIRRHV